ncbi:MULTISPECIES: DUF58 domain-containing protein [Salinibaculum]|uniref:DUF58 domain-containing protein n=1 Tax=Salinibaculum TaxID=2732368 RepID=UPI0030D071F8
MRPTRRGVAALVVVALAMGLAWAAGERALNAVAAPLLAAFLFGAFVVWRAPEPAVAYGRLQSGYPGDERTLTIDVAGGALVTLDLHLPEGLATADVDTVVSPPATVERTLTLARRGIYRLDPPRVRQRDPLGFVERRVDVDATTEFVVYPRVYEMDAGALSALFADELAAERQQFDRLREYEPGDPLKNVHWKSSAKRDDLLVMEFAAAEQHETVHVAAEAAEGYTDEMAAAAATLATSALEAGLTVSLTAPDDSLPAETGDEHREALLRLLSRTGPGRLPAEVRESADVAISADAEGTTVRLADRTQSFEAVRGTGGAGTGEVVP